MVGVFFLVIPIIWITENFINNEIAKPLDWMYFLLCTTNGVVQIIGGFGFKLERLVGKAFVLIDRERISLKPGVFDKEQRVDWKDMKTIEYRLNKFRVRNIDNSSKVLDLSKFDYDLKKSIKEVVANIAKEKNIEAIM
jgi:hypothetical protein